MTFLYTLNRGDKKTEGEKVFFFKVYNKVEIWFLVLVFGFSLSNGHKCLKFSKQLTQKFEKWVNLTI